MIYFDTAYLAKAYLNEPGSAVVRDYLKNSGATVASSSLARAELAAVFHRHLREGRLDAASYTLILNQYQLDLHSNVWEWLPVEDRFWGLIVLRGADAIHLVTARAHGFSELFTNDRHMLKACDTLGLKGRNIL